MDGRICSWSLSSSQIEVFPHTLQGSVTCLVWCHGKEPEFLAASDTNGSFHIFRRYPNKTDLSDNWKHLLSFHAHQLQVILNITK